ncbi:tripartite tricarboxylate transporter substrate binding protein [Comamonas sp.]|uniref:tripartite tricarboxylate transporter substrate binding protein n=1 Tax=Comamonas sp. TaxID=34028 RepID=UPI003A8ED3B8
MSAQAFAHQAFHPKRPRWLAVMGVACCALLGGIASAQNSSAAAPVWKPSKSPEFIVPSGAGAALDVAARKLTELLAREGLSPSFVVSNKSGAHSISALESLHRHAGDAHTLMTLSSSYGNSLAQNALPAHLQKATPLVTLFREFTTVVVRADSPIRNAQDLIAQLRQDPEKYSIGIATTLGNHIHLGVAQPLRQGGVHIQKLRIIPYKSSAESMTALVGGHLDVVSATTPNLLPYLQAGRVRVLAIAANQRLEGAFAQSPTWKEQGIDYVSDSFQGVMTTPAATAQQQTYWVGALRRVSETREWKDFVALNQWEPIFLGPQETANALHTQVQRNHALLAELGLLPAAAVHLAKAR